MALLEQIQQMKNQGMPDDEIITTLHEQGISPKEINDAINQSQIKRAVIDERNSDYAPQGPPSPTQSQENYFPRTQTPEYSNQESSQQYSQQEYIQPQEYQQGEYGYSQGTSSDTDTIIEISEQVFSEKIKKIQKQVEDISEFKTLAQAKIENLSERLKRIETSFDKLQMAILGEIGSYGNNIEAIKKEMSMMQESFSKVVNQAVRGHKTSEEKSSKKNSKK